MVYHSGGFGTSTGTGVFGQSGQTNIFGAKTTSGGLFGNSSTTFSAPSAFTSTSGSLFGNKPVRFYITCIDDIVCYDCNKTKLFTLV